MKIKIISIVTASIIPVFSGCASEPPIALAPVGPGPAASRPAMASGYLQVFSDTETHQIGDDNYYYPHTGYSIHDQSGKVVQYVPNHIGDMDEAPSLVNVPAGKYNIVARSASYGRVTVPVIIESGRTTVVHLDRDWKTTANNNSGQVVRLPDGEAVGWSQGASGSVD